MSSASLSVPKTVLWLDWGSSWAWRRWDRGSEGPESSGASCRAEPDSPSLSFRPGKAPGLAARGWGHPRNRGTGAERKGLLSKTRQRPTKAAGLFISAPKQTGHFPGLGALWWGGTNPSELGLGCYRDCSSVPLASTWPSKGLKMELGPRRGERKV